MNEEASSAAMDSILFIGLFGGVFSHVVVVVVVVLSLMVP
jgi:hypothetical protein